MLRWAAGLVQRYLVWVLLLVAELRIEICPSCSERVSADLRSAVRGEPPIDRLAEE